MERDVIKVVLIVVVWVVLSIIVYRLNRREAAYKKAGPKFGPYKREERIEKMMGYVARDKNGKLYFFPDYARIAKNKNLNIWTAVGCEHIHMMPRLLFPEVKWEDEKPTEVEVTFKIRK